MQRDITPELKDIPPEAWPPLFRSMSEFLPAEALLSMAEYFGGTAINVPLRFRPYGRLAAALGETAARELIGRYGGERLDIPRAVNVRRFLRDHAVRLSRGQGHSVNSIAKRFKLTRRQIGNILRRPNA